MDNGKPRYSAPLWRLGLNTWPLTPETLSSARSSQWSSRDAGCLRESAMKSRTPVGNKLGFINLATGPWSFLTKMSLENKADLHT